MGVIHSLPTNGLPEILDILVESALNLEISASDVWLDKVTQDQLYGEFRPGETHVSDRVYRFVHRMKEKG
jgi:hypothetical protein